MTVPPTTTRIRSSTTSTRGGRGKSQTDSCPGPGTTGSTPAGTRPAKRYGPVLGADIEAPRWVSGGAAGAVEDRRVAANWPPATTRLGGDATRARSATASVPTPRPRRWRSWSRPPRSSNDARAPPRHWPARRRARPGKATSASPTPSTTRSPSRSSAPTGSSRRRARRWRPDARMPRRSSSSPPRPRSSRRSPSCGRSSTALRHAVMRNDWQGRMILVTDDRPEPAGTGLRLHGGRG